MAVMLGFLGNKGSKQWVIKLRSPVGMVFGSQYHYDHVGIAQWLQWLAHEVWERRQRIDLHLLPKVFATREALGLRLAMFTGVAFTEPLSVGDGGHETLTGQAVPLSRAFLGSSLWFVCLWACFPSVFTCPSP